MKKITLVMFSFCLLFLLALPLLILTSCGETVESGNIATSSAAMLNESCNIALDMKDIVDTLAQENAFDQKTLEELKTLTPIMDSVCTRDGSIPLGSMQDILSRVIPVVRVAVQLSPLTDGQKQIAIISVTLIEKRLERLIPELQTAVPLPATVPVVVPAAQPEPVQVK